MYNPATGHLSSATLIACSRADPSSFIYLCVVLAEILRTLNTKSSTYIHGGHGQMGPAKHGFLMPPVSPLFMSEQSLQKSFTGSTPRNFPTAHATRRIHSFVARASKQHHIFEDPHVSGMQRVLGGSGNPCGMGN